MTARCVTHSGHSPDWNGLVASYLGRDGASSSIYQLLVMILGNISDRGETETPAVDLLICNREEEPDPTSTLHSNDDACLKPPGRQVFEDIKWKTRGQTLRIATWNVRTMFQAGKLDNVIQ